MKEEQLLFLKQRFQNKTKWWEYLLLLFIPPNYSMDISDAGTVRITYKKMFGKTYYVKEKWL